MTTLSKDEAKTILNLPLKEDISKEDIKKAFKILAKKSHPDHNGGENNLDEFVLITKAKEILLKEERIYLLPLSIGELMAGTLLHGFKTICGTCHGLSVLERNECPDCHGTGGKEKHHDNLIVRDFCETCGGKGVIEKICPACHEGHKIFAETLKIPAGTKPETILTTSTGEMIQIILKKEKNRVFSVRDNDIYGSTRVPWTKMIHGGIHIAKDPNETPIELKIKPGSPSGTTIRIPNKGFRSKDGNGSIIFKIYPIVPKPDDVSGTALKLAIAALSRSGF